MPLPTFVTNISHNVILTTQRFGRITILVLFIWTLTLWWGERVVFEKSASACEWQRWESWPANASPHHVLFIADPQLVDPHTYPDRPWPLSTLTILYTDLYLRRTYRYLLNHVQPHTTMFLGDLFDGGREWAVDTYKSPDDRYKIYGMDFWLREYNRFMNLYVGGWYNHDWHGYLTGEGRKIIASLPGNHDLGFASGIDEHVRNRFEAHFGPSNRVDILGNHTFVSLDTVSLSAMDQVDPVTGGFGAGDGTGRSTKHMEIWKPVENFLIGVNNQRAKAIQRRYQHLRSLPNIDAASNGDFPSAQKEVPIPSSNFPTILLSHVPLFRDQSVQCGPFRERGNAIPLSAGIQYQNVLTPAISKDIVDHLDAEQLTMIYSGDDHDYCEIEHGEFTGRIKEITVKSTSWAMGVRKPGVQLASLWNPLDMEAFARGEAPTSTPRDTVQNRLCLLPDQLSIFIRYGQVLGLSLVLLALRAGTYDAKHAHQQLLSISPIDKDKSSPLLPLNRKRTPSPTSSNQISPVTTNTSTPQNKHAARARSNGKLSAYGNLPTSSRSSSPISSTATTFPTGTDDWGMPTTSAQFTSQLSAHRQPTTPPHPAMSFLNKLAHNLGTPARTRPGEFTRSFALIAGPVLFLYSCLLWNG